LLNLHANKEEFMDTTSQVSRFTQHVHHHDPESARRAVEELETAQRANTERLKARRVRLYSAGRIMLALLFVTAGIVKALRFTDTVNAMAGFPTFDSTFLLGAAILIELSGGLLLGLGYQTRKVGIVLCAYLAAVTAYLVATAASDMAFSFALSNLGFVGALLMLVAHGAGAYSLDRLLERRQPLK
jgi:putative oxidoreductase